MAELTFDELYADLINARRREPPSASFTAAQFSEDAGLSISRASSILRDEFNAGRLERELFGKKFYYWFKANDEK